MKPRYYLLRIMALVIGLLVPISIELVCRFFVEDLPSTDGYVEYLNQRPLFVLNQAQQVYEVADNRRAFFAQDSFPKLATSKTKRIFVLGGSTVQGRPYSLPTSFPTCMQVGLETATKEYDWDVVNCGGVSYASYRLLPILDEVLSYNPAAIVLCVGHNEFLEFMTYRDAVQAIDTFGESAVGWSNLATVRVLRSWVSQPDGSADVRQRQVAAKPLPTEVDALLDQLDGWQLYHRDGLDRDRICRQFSRNIQRMVTVCGERQVPLLLVSPVINLRDCPPFKSEFDSSISEVEQEQFLQQLVDATGTGTMQSQQASLVMARLCDQQPQYALAWYQMGRLLLDLGQTQEALAAFQRACDEDVCPLRMTSGLRSRLQQIAENSKVDFVDLQLFFQAESRHGIVGDDKLVDHVHPSFASQRKIGCLLAERLMQMLEIPPAISNWQQPTLEKLSSDFDTLGSIYFLRGRRALDNLNGWARGRSHGTDLNALGEREQSQ